MFNLATMWCGLCPPQTQSVYVEEGDVIWNIFRYSWEIKLSHEFLWQFLSRIYFLYFLTVRYIMITLLLQTTWSIWAHGIPLELFASVWILGLILNVWPPDGAWIGYPTFCLWALVPESQLWAGPWCQLLSQFSASWSGYPVVCGITPWHAGKCVNIWNLLVPLPWIVLPHILMCVLNCF